MGSEQSMWLRKMAAELDHGSGEDYLECADELDRLTSIENALVHNVQKYQPGGSPPPGDLACLVLWILEAQAAKVAALQADLDTANHWRERHSKDAEANGKQSAEHWNKWKAAEAKVADLQNQVAEWKHRAIGGTCRVLSDPACDCPLCQRDRTIAALQVVVDAIVAEFDGICPPNMPSDVFKAAQAAADGDGKDGE